MNESLTSDRASMSLEERNQELSLSLKDLYPNTRAKSAVACIAGGLVTLCLVLAIQSGMKHEHKKDQPSQPSASTAAGANVFSCGSGANLGVAFDVSKAGVLVPGTVPHAELLNPLACGTEIEHDSTKATQPPNITVSSAEDEKWYTLMMLDPDHRESTSSAPYRCWMVVNLPGKALRRAGGWSSITSVQKHEGITFASSIYQPPQPANGTGYHRFSFVLHEQDAGSLVETRFEEDDQKAKRGKWDVKDFLAKYRMSPVSWNVLKVKQS